MLTKNILELQQSNDEPTLSGCWKLAPARAISLQPRAASVLRISQGRVWITLDGPHQGHGNESGDHFLQAGQQMEVGAGQRLVMESWSEAAVYFEWTLRPVPAGFLARWVAGLDWRAFRAASSANRAQGAISCGDSIASSGAL